MNRGAALFNACSVRLAGWPALPPRCPRSHGGHSKLGLSCPTKSEVPSEAGGGARFTPALAVRPSCWLVSPRWHTCAMAPVRPRRDFWRLGRPVQTKRLPVNNLDRQLGSIRQRRARKGSHPPWGGGEPIGRMVQTPAAATYLHWTHLRRKAMAAMFRIF